MYRTFPPIFDVHEFPTLRRVKPLPKRRRTALSLASTNTGAHNVNPDLPTQNSTSSVGTRRLVSPHASYIAPPYLSQTMLHAAGTLVSLTYPVSASGDVGAGDDSAYAVSVGMDPAKHAVINEGGSGGNEQQSGVVGLPAEQQQQQQEQEHISLSPNGASDPPSTPPPSGTSTDEEGEARLHQHPSHVLSYSHLDPNRGLSPLEQPKRESGHGHANYDTSAANVNTNAEAKAQEEEEEEEEEEEDVDSEGTMEGDLQERLFLRAEADRLLAHADSLSARMALQNYYRSMGFGVPEFSTAGGSVELGIGGGDAAAAAVTSSVPVTGESAAGTGLDSLSDGYVVGSVPSMNVMDLPGDATTLGVGVGSRYVAVGTQGQAGVVDGLGDQSSQQQQQQGQGNSKKRKVPANVGNSPPLTYSYYQDHYYSQRGGYGHDDGDFSGDTGRDGGDGDDGGGGGGGFGFDFGLSLGTDADVAVSDNTALIGSAFDSDVFGPLPTGTYQREAATLSTNLSTPGIAPPPRRFVRKPKLTAVTLAGIGRKELVKSRKKQLEAVLGPLVVGDPWALDHALSTHFPALLSSLTSAAAASSPPSSSTTSSERSSTSSDSEEVGFGSMGGRRTGAKGTREDNNDSNNGLGRGWSEGGVKDMKVRLSKRKRVRDARMAKMRLGRLKMANEAVVPFPTREFTFTFPSFAAQRLDAIRAEVTNLRSLFGSEIARQTAKAAAAKMTSGGKARGGESGKKKSKKRAQQRARTIKNASAMSGDQKAEFLDIPPGAQSGLLSSQQRQQQLQSSQQQIDAQQQQLPQQASLTPSQSQGQTSNQTPKKGKKKKRSALANASNPHHLRNYVPSRLPNGSSGGGGGGGGGGGSHGQAGQHQTGVPNTLWPFPFRFLSAELPPRRKRKGRNGGQTNVPMQTLPQVVDPQEEWICPFCEYSLFYREDAEDAEYRRAIRNRKKVLRRRRRARERAAAAASGVNAGMMKSVGAFGAGGDKLKGEEDAEEDIYDGPGFESMPSTHHLQGSAGGGKLKSRAEPPG